MTEKKKPSYDPQAAFEEAIASGTQTVVIKRKYEKHFPLFSKWEHEGRLYEVYMILNAGEDLKIGFMVVRQK